ncbi:MAG: YheU family protein [Bdellovibrionota bacterium]
MDIPWEQLQPETLQALIEEFVSRDGTDYGAVEISMESKTRQVHRLLQQKRIKVVFDPDTESCDLREVTP